MVAGCGHDNKSRTSSAEGNTWSWREEIKKYIIMTKWIEIKKYRKNYDQHSLAGEWMKEE